MSDLLSLVHEHYATMNNGDLEGSKPLFAEDVETITPGGTLHGRDAFLAMGQAFLKAVPDMRHEVVRSFEDGDTIVVEGIYSGTHTGPLESPQGTIPATGRTFAFPFADFLQVRDGTCVSHRVYWDNVSFLAQLGVIPES